MEIEALILFQGGLKTIHEPRKGTHKSQSLGLSQVVDEKRN